MKTTERNSTEEMFKLYVKHRVGLMPQQKEENITPEELEKKQVVFLTPVGMAHQRSFVGRDEFPQMRDKLLQPAKQQSFFSFVNLYGGHWSLVENKFQNGAWQDSKTINCKGDGACGVHAMVNAVLNSENLKTSEVIKKAAKESGLNLKDSSSKNLETAINFVIGVIKSGTNSDDENTRVINKLTRLRDTDGAYAHWVDGRDIEIFAQALDVLCCNPNKLQNQEDQNLVIEERKQFIIRNLKGEANSGSNQYDLEEKNAIINFCDGDVKKAADIIKYAIDNQVENHTEVQDHNSYEKDLERAIKESLEQQKKYTTTNGLEIKLEDAELQKALEESLKFVDKEDEEFQLRLAIALSLSEQNNIKKQDNIESIKTEEAYLGYKEALKSQPLQELEKILTTPPGKSPYVKSSTSLQKTPANNNAIEAVSQWIKSKQSDSDPIVQSVKSSLDTQTKNPNPDGAYVGIGIDLEENEDKSAFIIADVFAKQKPRFSVGGKPVDQNSMNGQFITAITIDGKTTTIKDLLKKENGKQEIAEMFHFGLSHAIQFTMKDSKGFSQEVTCEKRNDLCFVTNHCLSAQSKLKSKNIKGDAYDPKEYGIEPLGVKFSEHAITQQAR